MKKSFLKILAILLISIGLSIAGCFVMKHKQKPWLKDALLSIELHEYIDQRQKAGLGSTEEDAELELKKLLRNISLLEHQPTRPYL